ncbi:hypothetical protein K440DRAFT_682401 [Wilcoxina mikolae CBS 423.85]|nr:hypothetical protein K440DRAFT_682401 [Wilcoxina mikolae CBS 423.85]
MSVLRKLPQPPPASRHQPRQPNEVELEPKATPRAREAVPSVTQMLGTFIDDDNETFQNVVQMGGSLEIGGVMRENFVSISTARADLLSSIFPVLDTRGRPPLQRRYTNSSRRTMTPDCSITNKGFEDCPWLVVEIANTQTYDKALDKMYPYLIAFGIIIDLIKEQRSPKRSVQATQTAGVELGMNTPRTMQDGFTFTVKSDTSVASSSKFSKLQPPGAQLAIFSRAIFNRGTKLEEGTSSPTSIVDPIHDRVEIFPAMPTLEWIVKWSDLPFAVQLSEEEKDFEYRISFTELHSVIKKLSHPPKSLKVVSPMIPQRLLHCVQVLHDLHLRNAE